MAILAHAASAEDGSGFGRPGDQTGREVRMETLGADGNDWVYIYRYEKDPKVAKNIGEANRQACMNQNVGYSRETYTGWGLYYTRYGLWTAAHETGDIRKIEVPVNCDCSQLQITATWIAGVPNAEKYRNMVTAVQDETLKALGFTRYDYKLEDTMDGDILWRPGHTGCVVEGWKGTPVLPTVQYRGKITKLTPVFKTPKAIYENILLAHPYLGVDNLVDVCDQTEGFYYVKIVDVYGYVPMDALVRDGEKPKEFKIGDKVKFIGDKFYPSAGSTKGVEVPNFSGEIKNIAAGKRHPYYIYSKRYDGWCNLKDLERK